MSIPESPLRLCPHGFHHPEAKRLDYPHSCDGCWCEGERDRRLYGWNHSTSPVTSATDNWAATGDAPVRSYVTQLWEQDWSSPEDKRWDAAP